MFYLAFIFALALACVAGVLYFYMLFLEGRIRQQGRRIAELERTCRALSEELDAAAAVGEEEREHTQESWPDLVDENNDYPVR